MKRLFSFLILSLSMAISVNAQIIVSGTAGGTLNGSYTSLTNAGGVFAALNSGGSQIGQIISVSITVNILSETGTNSLNSGNWTSITINPSGSRTVSGTVAAPLIILNGADNVTINGLNTGENSLTISNLSTAATAATSTIRFINGATANTVTNCTILGSSQNTLDAEGGNILFSADELTPNGNDNNTISNCDIGPASATLPFKAIFSLGSTSSDAIRNSGNVINNCNIFNFFGAGTSSTAGINIISGNDNWTISNNRIYQTAARVFNTALSRYSGMILNTTSLPGSFTVSGNRIGFANSAGTGITSMSGSSNEFRGIAALSVSTTTLTSITGNTISGITQTTSSASLYPESAAFIGVVMGISDGLINATLNNIGSLNGSSSIVLTATSVTDNTSAALGLFNYSFQNTTISYNNVGFITITGPGTRTGFTGIYVNTDQGLTATISENTISDITDTQVGSYQMFGIQSFAADASIVNNIVRNITGSGNYPFTIVMAGIQALYSEGDNNIEKNKIYNLKNTGGSSFPVSVYGIDVSFPETTNEIKQNYVYGLSLTSTVTTSEIWGIVRRGEGNATIYNNMVSLGLNMDGSSITTGFSIMGFFDAAVGSSGSFNYYYNSVYIGGSGVISGQSSYALYSSVFSNPRNFINNNLWNNRGNTVAGGAPHFAISLGGFGVNPAGLASNYNNLFASGIDGKVGFYNGANRLTIANWQAATGQDVNSVSVAASFAGVATGNLHLVGVATGTGIPVSGIITDIDGDTRSAVNPYKGADEVSFSLTLTINFEACNTEDTITVELRNATSPFALVESHKGLGGQGIPHIIQFGNAVNGTPYYIVVKHRNSIRTFSGSTPSFSGGSLNYDFTTASSQAFGNNLVQVGSLWSFYTGDINQDDVVDGTDGSLVDNDAFNFVLGYVATDVNCDDVVDGTDAVFVETNSTNFIIAITP